MVEEESDWEEGPTIEEIISVVQKRPSMFGKLLSSRPPSAVKNPFLKKYTSPEPDQQPEPKTWGIRSYVEKNTKTEAKTSSSILSVLNNTSNLNNHKRLSPANQDRDDSQDSGVHHLTFSTCKMPRSISTPVIRSKLSITPPGKEDADISNCADSQAGNNYATQSTQYSTLSHLDKENLKPTSILSDNFQISMQTDRLKHAYKDPQLGNEYSRLSVDCVDSSSKGKSDAKSALILQGQKITNDSSKESFTNMFSRNNVMLQQQMVNYDAQKRDSGMLYSYSKPSKIANTAFTPLKMENHPLKVSPPLVEPRQNGSEVLQLPISSSQSRTPTGESITNQSLSVTGTRVTIPVVVQTSSVAQSNAITSKAANQSSSQEHRSLHSHPINTEVGNISSSVKASNLSQIGIAQMFHTPSGNIQRIQLQQKQEPSTPSASQMMKKMDHIAVKDHIYAKLGILGRGGSSKVYEVLDLESRKVKAIKVVELEGLDDATISSYKNEVEKLERLQWSDRIIKLYDFEYIDNQLLLVMEKGNTDFASILKSIRSKNSAPIPAFTIKFYWQGMLFAVQAIHNEGIIHSDLKPANFVLVNQTVKLIDFGIASSIQQDKTSVIKDSQAGTFNYMSPESLMDVKTGPLVNNLAAVDKVTIKIGVKSDVWSLGCILYNLVYGKTPFQEIVNPLQKLVAISNPNHMIAYPEIEDEQLLDVMKQCLQFEPRKRPSIQQLLQHPYLTDNSNQSIAASPEKRPNLKSVINQLAQLTPNSLCKITSMMQQMKPNPSSLTTQPSGK